MLFRNERNWSPCALLIGIENRAVALENSTAFPQKVKHRIIVWCSSSPSWYILQKIQNQGLDR